MKNEARARGIRRFVLAAIVGGGLLAALSEVGLRFLLFHSSGFARRVGEDLRKPEWYADPLSEEAYWKLRYVFTDPARRAESPAQWDPVCGWTGDIDARTRRPVAPVDLRGRRPVLLYADAFADCSAFPRGCFEELLEKSPLSDRYCLVNYGVPGFGVDQEYLLLKQSIDLWKDFDPIVVIGLPSDDRLCRSLLSFTEWPKPRISIEGEALDVEPAPDLDAPSFILAHPIGIRSYLARLLSRPLRPDGSARAKASALVAKLVGEMQAELAARGLAHFLLVFDGREDPGWARELVDAIAARLAIPSVRTGPFLLAAAGGSRATAESELFDASGNYNELGILVAFEALRQGIEGRFGAEDPSRVSGILDAPTSADPGWKIERRVFGCSTWSAGGGPSTIVRYSRTPYAPFDRRHREDYLILRPGPTEPLLLLVKLSGKARHLRARASTVKPRGAPGRPDLVISVRLDGRLATRTDVPAWPGFVDLDLDLAGAGELVIEAERAGDSESDAWVHLAGARIE